jgi:hypothetical protein
MSPHPILEDPSKHPLIYAWVSPLVYFPQVSSPKPCTRLSPPSYALHAQPISFFSKGDTYESFTKQYMKEFRRDIENISMQK